MQPRVFLKKNKTSFFSLERLDLFLSSDGLIVSSAIFDP